MAWCSDHGLPHSALLAWQPQDRAKLQAHLMEVAERCVSCGTSPWEWSPAAGGDPHAYTPTLHKCPGCFLREAAQEDMKEQQPGTRIVLTPRAIAEAWAADQLPEDDDD